MYTEIGILIYFNTWMYAAGAVDNGSVMWIPVLWWFDHSNGVFN